MKKGWKIVLAILCAFVIAAGSFIAAVQYLNTRYAAALSAREEDSPVQAKAAEVQEIIETYFIDDYDEDTLADGAASGMVDVDDLAIFLDRALLRLIQAEQDAHQRGLARAVFTEQRMDLAAPQLQGDVVVGLDPWEFLRDVQHLDHVFRSRQTHHSFSRFVGSPAAERILCL